MSNVKPESFPCGLRLGQVTPSELLLKPNREISCNGLLWVSERVTPMPSPLQQPASNVAKEKDQLSKS